MAPIPYIIQMEPNRRDMRVTNRRREKRANTGKVLTEPDRGPCREQFDPEVESIVGAHRLFGVQAGPGRWRDRQADAVAGASLRRTAASEARWPAPRPLTGDIRPAIVDTLRAAICLQFEQMSQQGSAG